MRHWHSRRVVGRFRTAGALKGKQTGGLVRRPPGAQNSFSAKASEWCHRDTGGGAHKPQFSPHTNQSKSPWGRIQLVQKQRMCLLQAWPAFSGVTAREWLGQDQQVPILSPNVDNHICRVQRRGGAKVRWGRSKLVILFLFYHEEATWRGWHVVTQLGPVSWGKWFVLAEKNLFLSPCRIMPSINYSEIICSRKWWAMGNDAPSSLRSMPP